MPRSNSRPRWKCPEHGTTQLRNGVDECPRCETVRPMPSKPIAAAADVIVEQLKDRRDYRLALIHRVATAHGERKGRLNVRIAEIETQISGLIRSQREAA